MRTIKRTVDLDALGGVELLPGALFEGEIEAHTFQIAAQRSGSAAALTGTVSAVFDHETRGVSIPLVGSIVDGAAQVTLSEGCYRRGRFALTVYLSEGGRQTALYQARGTIRRAGDGAPYDPDDMIPNIALFTAQYQHMEEATQAAQAAASMAVRYDAAQPLTEAQKAQARENVGAADSAAQANLATAQAAQGLLYETVSQRVTAADARITVLESVVGAGEGMTPAQLSAIAASGHADHYFSPGDIIQIPWTDTSGDTAVEYQMPFVIVDIADAYDENDTKHEKAIWLQALRTTPYAIPFHAADRTEVDLSTETAAVSGWAYVGLSGTTYTALNLSPGDPIPTTYDAVYKTTYTGLALKAVQTGIARWKDSDARQWLNSTAAKDAGWWESQYDGATPPAAEYTNKPGFLGGFSADWQAVFKPVKRSNGAYLDEVTQTTDITYDKVFLPHWANVYATYASGDNVNWPYWVSAVGTSTPTPNSSEARVLSPLGSTSTVTWLLSSYRLASRMDQVRGINSRGAMDYYNSNSAYRMAPCVCML